MGGGTLSNELLDMFDYSAETATSSAFVQRKSKIKVEAFETVFKSFTTDVSCNMKSDKMRILAVDGSDIHIPTNSDDKESFFQGTIVSFLYRVA